MPFTNEYFENAKEKANKRLHDWIKNIKEDRPITGIPRLQLQFGGVFKKIEWKPRATDEGFLAERKHDLRFERLTTRGLSSAKHSENDEMKISGLFGRSSIPRNLHLEDQRLYDSNSSNISSSLEQREDVVGKHSGYNTALPGSPVVRTPFSIGNTAAEEEENRGDTSDSFDEPFVPPKPRQRRGAVDLQDKPIMHLLKKRKRKKVKQDQMKTDITNLHDKGETLPNVPAALRKTSSMLVDGSRPKSSATCIKVNYGTKKGLPLELIFRRTHKATRFIKLVNAPTSKDDLTAASRPKEQTSEARRASVLANFRRMVRLLIHVRVLLNVSRIRIEEEEKSKEFKRLDGDHELSFDPMAYKSAFTCGGLNVRIRRALKKNPAERNEEDARMLMEVMLRMPVFIKYPSRVKEWLARQMWYDCFHDGRVIIKQGDPGSRMYFVVSGEVDLKRTDVSLTGEVNSYHLKTLTAGATFGEIALIRDMHREFTAICKGTSEFLSLSKAEFNNALRHRWEQDYNIRFNFLRSCEIFQTWTDKQLQICADSSELKEYKDKKVILGNTDGLTDSVYFIRKGRCDVVRRIIVLRRQSPYMRPSLFLHQSEKRREQFLNKPYARSRRICKKEVHFMTVTTLSPGNYFGAGEDLRDTFILSRGKTECIVTNAAQFSIQGKSEQLRTLARNRENNLPSNESLYKKFQVNRRWYEYKDKVLKELYSRTAKRSNTTISDVPQTIKNEPRIPDYLINYRQ